MDSHLDDLNISLEDTLEGHSEDIANAIKVEVVDKAGIEVNGSRDLDADAKVKFTDRFVTDILHLSLDDKFNPSKGQVTISGPDMRNLTGYDWAREKSIALTIVFTSPSEKEETTEIAPTPDIPEAKAKGITVVEEETRIELPSKKKSEPEGDDGAPSNRDSEGEPRKCTKGCEKVTKWRRGSRGGHMGSPG